MLWNLFIVWSTRIELHFVHSIFGKSDRVSTGFLTPDSEWCGGQACRWVGECLTGVPRTCRAANLGGEGDHRVAAFASCHGSGLFKHFISHHSFGLGSFSRRSSLCSCLDQSVVFLLGGCCWRVFSPGGFPPKRLPKWFEPRLCLVFPAKNSMMLHLLQYAACNSLFWSCNSHYFTCLLSIWTFQCKTSGKSYWDVVV